MGALGNVRENRHPIRQYLYETASNREIVLLLPRAIPKLADLQRSQKCSMTGQHAEVPFGSGNLDLVDLFAHKGTLRGDDFQQKLCW